MFTSWTKREINHFHAVVVQRRQRNVQTKVMHEQTCCFANVNLLLSGRSRCRRRRRCLSSLTAKYCVPSNDPRSLWEKFLGLVYSRLLSGKLRAIIGQNKVGVWS